MNEGLKCEGVASVDDTYDKSTDKYVYVYIYIHIHI